MKLHLPKMLTAALLAAIATTTAQAAVTTYNISEWSTYDETLNAAVVGHGKYEVLDYTSYAQKFNSDWNFIVTVNSASISGEDDSLLTLMALSMTQTTKTGLVSGLTEGITLANASGTTKATLTSWSNAAAGGAKTLDLTGVNDLTFVMSRSEPSGELTMKVYANGDFSKTVASATQTGQKFSDTTVDYVALGGKGGMDKLNNASNKVSFPNDADTGSFEITKAGYLLGSLVTSADLIRYYNPATTLVWNGTAPSATWDTTSESWLDGEQPARYTSSLTTTANFNTGAVAKNVTVSGEIKADKVNVNDNYKFTVESGSTLTAGALTVADGMKATVAGTGIVTLDSISGALAIEAGATVNMASGTTVTLDATHQLPVSGEGTFGVTTLKVAGGTHDITNSLKVTGGGTGEGSGNNSQGIHFSAANSTLNLNAGTTTVTGAVYSNQGGTKINIGTGEKEATLVARRIELSDGGSSALHIGAKGKVVITSTNDTNGSTGAYKTTGLLLSEWLGSTTATVDGKLYAQSVGLYTGDAGMTLNVNKGGVVAVKGIATNLAQSGHTSSSTINLAEGGKIVLGASGMANCAIAPWNINLNGGEIGITADATLARAMNVAGNVTFNTAKYTWADSGATLNEGEAGGTMTVSGNLTGTGTITKTGDGTLVLSGAANVISNTINLQAGTLSLTGAYDISAIASTSQPTYDNGGSPAIAVGNGFQHTEGKVHVVDITAGAMLSAATATFTYGGAEHGTGLDANGDFALAGSTDYSTLYVNNNDGVSYSAAWDVAQAQTTPVAITSVVMAADTTLTADKADASITLTVKGDATVAASEATTIASIEGWSDSTLTITGEGAVTLPTGTLTLEGSTALVVDGNVNTSKLVIGSQVGDTAALTVNEGATLKVTGDLTPTHGTAALNGTVNISGSLDLSKSGASDVTLQIGGNGVVTSAGMWMAKTAGIELAEGGSYEVHKLQIEGKASGASITTTGDNVQYGTESAAFTISGADITATGNLVLGNKLVNSAVHTGEYTVTLNNTIAVGTGTLGLDGTFAIGGISGTENVSYTGGDNGYKTTSVTRAVYTKDEGGEVNVDPDSTFMVGEEVVDLLDDGTATTASVTDYATYYVNKGTDTVSNALMGHVPTAFRLAGSTTLTVDQNVAATVTGTDKTTSLVTIEAPHTLTGTASTVTLGGAGTYALTANTIGLGSNVVLGEDWTGTVLVSGVSGSAGNNLNIDALGRADSKVEINGFSGYFRQAQDVYAAQLVLTGDGMTLVDGFSTLASGDPKPPTTYTFDGGVSGDGDMTFSHKNGSKANVTQNLYFTGQLSDWTGSLNVVAGFTVNAHFNGQEVNADITHEGGTLNVYVGEGTTFKGGLNASSITVEDGADATLMNMGDEPVDLGNVTIDAATALSLYKGATATPEEEATLVIDDGHALTVAALGTLNADLVLNAGSRLDVSGTLGEGLIMGSDVSMWTGDLLAVTTEDGQTTNEAVVDAYLRAFFTEGSHEYYTLFTGVDTFSIDGIAQTQDLTFTDWLHFDLDAAHLFGNLVENTYAVVYHMGANAGEGTVALQMIPEPMTGTLSLLALAALAARRRKH